MGSRPYTFAEQAFHNNVTIAFRVLNPPLNVLPPEVVEIIAHFFVLAEREKKRLWDAWHRRSSRAIRRRHRWRVAQVDIDHLGQAGFLKQLHPNSRTLLLLHIPLPANAPLPEDTTGSDSDWGADSEDSRPTRPGTPDYSNSDED